MRSRLATVALVGTLGLAGGALLVPGLASAQSADGGASGRVGALKEALAGLVGDGTLTQAQADRVATTLDAELPERRGHGGPAVTAVRAVTVGAAWPGFRPRTWPPQPGPPWRSSARRTATAGRWRRSRRTTAWRRRRWSTGWSPRPRSGSPLPSPPARLRQAQADERKATLRERITDKVDRVPRAKGHGKGPGPRDEAPEADVAPEAPGGPAS